MATTTKTFPVNCPSGANVHVLVPGEQNATCRMVDCHIQVHGQETIIHLLADSGKDKGEMPLVFGDWRLAPGDTLLGASSARTPVGFGISLFSGAGGAAFGGSITVEYQD